MDDEKNSSEKKPTGNPSIWDAEPVTECATKSAGSEDIENKVIENNKR